MFCKTERIRNFLRNAMIKLVAYDSSDDADCSGNEEDACPVVRNNILDDEVIVDRVVKELVSAVSDGRELQGPNWTLDKRGNFNTFSRDATKTGEKLRRKRRYGDTRTRNSSSTDWSDMNWTSDSSSSSDSDRDLLTKTQMSSGRRTSDHELSDDSDCVYAKIVLDCRKRQQTFRRWNPRAPPKTRGELDLQDLPPIEDLYISVPENTEIRRVGVVGSVVDKLVVVQSDYDVPPLDEETWLVNDCRQPLGKVFEIFGPVPRPFYSIRFNHEEDAKKQLAIGSVVYFIPNNDSFTKTVFADALRRVKGSDASWEDNNEPPAEALEFSDDEEERRWKASLRGKATPGCTQNEDQDQLIHSRSGPSARPRATPRRNYRNSRGASGPPVGLFGSRSAAFSSPVMQNPWAPFQPHQPSSPFYPFPGQQLRMPAGPVQRFPMPLFRAPFPPAQFGDVQGRPAFGARPRLPAPRFGSPGNRGRGFLSPGFVDRRYVQNNG